jgi:hypothetical protein
VKGVFEPLKRSHREKPLFNPKEKMVSSGPSDVVRRSAVEMFLGKRCSPQSCHALCPPPSLTQFSKNGVEENVKVACIDLW